MPNLLSSLSVESTADGNVAVSWSSGAGAPAGAHIELSTGPTQDVATHKRAATVPLEAGGVLLPAAGTRTFVSVDGMVAADRHIVFDGPVNFRDIGGYQTDTGRTVRWGRVFRADTLVLSDKDLERFGDLGIRHVYDMRNEMERVALPNRLPADLEAEVVPLVSDDPEDNPMKTLGQASADDFLSLLYLHILERSAPTVGRIITGLASETEVPAVFHCSAGKDRTGLITGVLLSVLGVPADVIVDDYAMTGRYRTTEHVQQTVERIGQVAKLAPEVVAGMLEAPRPAMQLALAEIGEKYDGFDHYLTGPAKSAPDLPDRLRRVLLTD